MPEVEEDHPSPFQPLEAELDRMRRSTLTAAIDDVDGIIELLELARQQISEDGDSHKISMVMTRLQNPVKQKFDAITNDLKEVTKAQKAFGKSLDKALPQRDLPMEADAMADYPEHVSRAIGMHLLREGQFSVASTFVNETKMLASSEADPVSLSPPMDTTGGSGSNTDQDGDKDMDARSREDLQSQFTEMYEILAELRAPSKNLAPAIDWARTNSAKLEERGSNLEFELCKLQYIRLFKGVAERDPYMARNTPEDLARAFEYARQHFGRFQRRHMREIAELAAAMVYASNLQKSPYSHLFSNDTAFDDVALNFTREFCSLLGLSAESPLYIAVTAGSIALPRLIKYTTYMKEKKTEWTTDNELAFETPLPRSMIYHPIFVCPVSKEQTTEQNPPMILVCGHVISQDSLQNIAKGPKYKCPYCPQEGQLADAQRIYL